MDILGNFSFEVSVADGSGLSRNLQQHDFASMTNAIDKSLAILSSQDNVTIVNYRDLSHKVASVLYIINYGVINCCVCLLGIVGNAFNIIVFAKQGFQETVNVTLFAMAISDLASLVTLLYLAVSFNPLFTQADLSFYPIEVQVLFGGWPHVMFLRITAWLTAFISLERCFCVILPLKVKTIFTLRRVKFGVIAIYFLVTASMAPTYYYTRLGWRFVPEKNRSMLGLTYTDDRAEIESVSYLINSVLSPVGYFAIILISTSILVISLNRKSKWRQQVSKPGVTNAPNVSSSKDQKVVKMVVTIAVIFVVFLLPSNVIFVWQTIEPEFYIVGKYQNMFKVAVSFTLSLEAANSSVNTLVYYHMSSNYRTVFRYLICRKTKEINTSLMQ